MLLKVSHSDLLYMVLRRVAIVLGGPKDAKLLADISFESSLQNTVLPSLLLFLCARY